MESPDDLLGYADIETLSATHNRKGTIKRSGLRAMRSNGRMPPPDDLTFPDRPRWRRDTIMNWFADRPGQGKRTDRERTPVILTDKQAFTPPTCPTCGALATVDWIDIQFSGPAQGGWMPGQIECPNGHIPAPGETWPTGEINNPDAVARMLGLDPDAT